MDQSEINKIWSNVLTYRPYIEISQNYNYKKEEDYLVKKNNVLTKTVETYKKFNPFNIINKINDSLKIIEGNLKLIEDDINYLDVAFINSFDINDNNYVEKILNDNNNIKGNSVFEAYIICKNDMKYLNSVKTSISNSYFENTEENSMKEEHELIVEKITANEIKNEIEKNNYFAISFDSYMSSMIDAYVDEIIKANIKLYPIISVKREIEIQGDNDSINTLIEEQFDSISKFSSYNMNEYINNVNDFSSNNYIGDVMEQREKGNLSINAYTSIDKSIDEGYVDVIIEMKKHCSENAFSTCNDYIKYLMNILNNRIEYNNNLSVKEGFKNIYINK